MPRFTYKGGKQLVAISNHAFKVSVAADCAMGRIEQADVGRPTVRVIVKAPTVKAFVHGRQKKRAVSFGG